MNGGPIPLSNASLRAVQEIFSLNVADLLKNCGKNVQQFCQPTAGVSTYSKGIWYRFRASQVSKLCSSGLRLRENSRLRAPQ